MSEVDDDEGARRFEQDLEFVQSLANPRYLNRGFLPLFESC